MNTRGVILILTVLTVFTAMIGIACAQEIDIDNLSYEQLLELQQLIAQKLAEEYASGKVVKGAEPDAAETAAADESPVDAVLEVVDVPQKFGIYENKKLVIGKMPESYFILPDDGGNNGSDDEGTPGNNGGFHRVPGPSFYPVPSDSVVDISPSFPILWP